jgi:hypothetical protein
MDSYRALAEDFRRRRDELEATLPAMEGDEAEIVRRTLDHVDRVLTAIANDDKAAIEELLRVGEAASRILHRRVDRLN